MDFSILTEYFVLVVVVACLVVGYIIKHATFFKWINNNDIPVILAVVGALVNLLVSGLSVESVVWGAVMGLCSTGVHQSSDTTFIKYLTNFISEHFTKQKSE